MLSASNFFPPRRCGRSFECNPTPDRSKRDLRSSSDLSSFLLASSLLCDSNLSQMRGRSFERYDTPGRRKQSWDQQWHDHRGDSSAPRNSSSRVGGRRRSEEDPGFVHALPPDTNLRVEGMITDISRMSPATIYSYLTANRERLMDKTMFFVISRLARRGDCQRAYDVSCSPQTSVA